MLRRVSVVVLVLAALLAPACGGAGEGGLAFSIDDHEFTNDNLFDELRALERNEAFRLALQVPELAEVEGDAHESYTQEFVRWVIEARIFFTLIDEEFAARELELTEADRTAARDSFASFDFNTQKELTGAQVLAKFEREYRTQWIEDQARLNVLQGAFETPEEFGNRIGEIARSADVWVSSRYGTWNAVDLALEPPEGASTSTTSSDVPVPTGP